jgi:hypothetical protein
MTITKMMQKKQQDRDQEIQKLSLDIARLENAFASADADWHIIFRKYNIVIVTMRSILVLIDTPAPDGMDKAVHYQAQVAAIRRIVESTLRQLHGQV